MWLFLLILFSLAALVTLAKVSLLERKRNGLLLILVTALTPLIFAPVAVRISAQRLSAFAAQYSVLSDLCTVLVVESFVMLLLAAHLISTHYDGRNMSFGKGLCLLPSIGCVVGLSALLTYLFNAVTVRSFVTLAIVYSAAVFLFFVIGSGLMRLVLKDWLGRLETMLILSFLQLVAAMFLPLIARGLSPPDHLIRPDWVASVLSTACVLLFAALGYFIHGRRHSTTPGGIAE